MHELRGILMKPTHPCSSPLESQPCPNHRSLSLVADWEAQDDTWVGHHRQGRLKLRVRNTWMVLHLTQRLLNFDARDGVLLCRPPEASALTVVPVAPPCGDASDDDAKEEKWLEDQMQE